MSDVLQRVRAADPATELDRLLTDAQLEQWQEDGLRQVLAGAVVPLPRQPADLVRGDADVARQAASGTGRAHPSRLRRLLVPAAGVAAAAALAVVVVLPGGAQSATAATPPALHYAQASTASRGEAVAMAEQCLERQRSQRQAPTAFDVRWREWSLTTRVDGREVTSAVVPVEARLVRRADGSAELVRRTGAPQFPDRASRERWVDAGRPAARPVTVQEQRWAPGGFTPVTAHLPDEPDRLLDALSVDHPIAELGDAEVLVAIADTYRSGAPSPAQQAALFALAASRPGVQPLGRVADRAGRVGYALSVESSHTGLPTRFTAIFDPVTGRLLDLEQTLTRTAGALKVRVPATIAYTVFE